MKDGITAESTPRKIKPSERPHYVNNAEFSKAIVDYVILAKAAKAKGKPLPQLSEYIGACLLKIAEGLSRKPNFVRYTYREDMVMDGVENCIRAVPNFNVNVGTRTGLPNAFAYFTQICFFAFIRRIQKEKKSQDIKLLYMESAGIENFANFGEGEAGDSPAVGEGIVERVRHKVEQIHKRDAAVKAFGRAIKNDKKKAAKKSTTSSLEPFSLLS